MKTSKAGLIFLLFIVSMIASFAMGQKRTQPPSPQPLVAAELDKLAAQPSLEQGILRMAAEKLRQEKNPTSTIDLQLTVKISRTSNGCLAVCTIHNICWHVCPRPE